MVVLPWFNHMVNHGFTMINHVVELPYHTQNMVQLWLQPWNFFGRVVRSITVILNSFLYIICYFTRTYSENPIMANLILLLL